MIDSTKKVDYSIEFAHIYTNESFSQEHIKAVEILREKELELKDKRLSYVKLVMIDNYNPSDHILNIDNFFQDLKKVGGNSDAFIFEADLVQYKDFALDLMSKRHENSYRKYIKENGKIPCSFLIYVWYMIRLGIIEIKVGSQIHLLNKDLNTIKGEKIINILPERYKSVEKKAMEAIKKSDVNEKILNHIETIYY